MSINDKIIDLYGENTPAFCIGSYEQYQEEELPDNIIILRLLTIIEYAVLTADLFGIDLIRELEDKYK